MGRTQRSNKENSVSNCLQSTFARMSIANLLTGVLQGETGDMLQNAAMLAYLKQGDEAKPDLEAVLAGKLCSGLYKSLTKEDQYEAARTETTLAIAKWIKEHPRATESQKQEEVAKQIELFKIKIESI